MAQEVQNLFIVSTQTAMDAEFLEEILTTLRRTGHVRIKAEANCIIPSLAEILISVQTQAEKVIRS